MGSLEHGAPAGLMPFKEPGAKSGPVIRVDRILRFLGRYPNCDAREQPTGNVKPPAQLG